LAGLAERCPYSPAHTRGGRLYGGCEQRASGGGTFSVRERPGTAPTLPRPSTGRTAPWRVRGCSSRPQPSAVTDRVVRSGRRRCRTMASTSGPGGSSRWAPAHLAARPAVGCTHSYQPRCLTESPSDGHNPVRPPGRTPADPLPRDRGTAGLDCRTASQPPSAGTHRASVPGIIAIAGHDADFRTGLRITDSCHLTIPGGQPRMLPHLHHSATTRPPGLQPHPVPVQVTR
jgi:hypothetical protein